MKVMKAVAIERTVFHFVKQYIEDKMAAECSYDLTFRSHFLSRRKRSVFLHFEAADNDFQQPKKDNFSRQFNHD